MKVSDCKVGQLICYLDKPTGNLRFGVIAKMDKDGSCNRLWCKGWFEDKYKALTSDISEDRMTWMSPKECIIEQTNWRERLE